MTSTKSVLLLLFTFSIFNSFSQNVIDIALSDKSKLVYENVYQLKLKNDHWSINYYMESFNSKGKIDTLTFSRLVNKSQYTNSEKWKKNDFKKAFLVRKGTFLHKKQVLQELKVYNKQDIKKIKRQIRLYNNHPHEWRQWPVSISKPVFSDDNQYCIIGVTFGNSSGCIELYKKNNGEWKRIAIFNRFAF